MIAGGKTWQLTGQEYVRQWDEIMEIPIEEMHFQDRPGWLNWYDTSASQALLKYQNTSWADFLDQLRAAVEEELQ